jgi:hypothetical protein
MATASSGASSATMGAASIGAPEGRAPAARQGSPRAQQPVRERGGRDDLRRFERDGDLLDAPGDVVAMNAIVLLRQHGLERKNAERVFPPLGVSGLRHASASVTVYVTKLFTVTGVAQDAKAPSYVFRRECSYPSSGLVVRTRDS